MWVAGGASGSGSVTNYYGDVWRSSDGKNWTQTANGPFGGRYESQMVSFNNQLFLIGGNQSGTLKNDVWSSPDGITWTQILANNPAITKNTPPGTQFCAREDFTAFVFNNLIWVVGGTDAITGLSGLNDVWNSPDGITWTQVLGNSAGNATQFAPRWAFSATVLGGNIYVVDGHIPATGVNPIYVDVWSSANGSTWSLINGSFGPNCYHQTVANNNLLWTTCGYNGWNGGPMSLLASSPDGITWTYSIAPYPARFGHLSLSFGNQVWIMGGCDNRGSLTYFNDVWHGP
jgi:hypothetical protein